MTRSASLTRDDAGVFEFLRRDFGCLITIAFNYCDVFNREGSSFYGESSAFRLRSFSILVRFSTGRDRVSKVGLQIFDYGCFPYS